MQKVLKPFLTKPFWAAFQSSIPRGTSGTRVSVPPPGTWRWGLYRHWGILKREILPCASLISHCKDSARIRGTAGIGTAGISTEFSDPQGKSQARTWTSASREALNGFGKMRNLLARRRKSLRQRWDKEKLWPEVWVGGERHLLVLCLNRAESPREFWVSQETLSRPAQGSCPLQKIQRSFLKGWKG